jgi:hypothetical protein
MEGELCVATGRRCDTAAAIHAVLSIQHPFSGCLNNSQQKTLRAHKDPFGFLANQCPGDGICHSMSLGLKATLPDRYLTQTASAGAAAFATDAQEVQLQLEI